MDYLGENMNRIIKKSSGIGVAPGTLVHIGDKLKETVDVTLIRYNEDDYEKKMLNHIGDLDSTKDHIYWLNIDGLHDIKLMESIGKKFKLHPLIMEDILNTGQRTKVDDYDEYMFVVLKLLYFDGDKNKLSSEQISMILTDNYIISFQEKGGDIFDNVKKRLEAGKGNIRKLGADYLLYALLDSVVDSYFVILEKLGDQIDASEEDLMEEPKKENLQNIHNLKREMLFLRNSIWPLREVISSILRYENTHIKPSTVVYIRDVYDHIIQVIDTVEIYRDMLSGMLDTYLSSISNKTNEVMKVLTIMSTIFIPITFLAGAYGMNFKYIPEYNWKWSYLAFWCISIGSTLLLLKLFKNKKWL